MAPPLPLAPDRAALSNRISLLLSSRSSLLKTLSPSTSSSPSSSLNKPTEDDDFKAPLPNHGVGYVPGKGDAPPATNKAYKALLRGAKRKREQRREESEDEEPGRSAVGRMKRVTPHKAVQGEREEQENEPGFGNTQAPEGAGVEVGGNAGLGNHDEREAGHAKQVSIKETGRIQNKKKKKKAK